MRGIFLQRGRRARGRSFGAGRAASRRMATAALAALLAVAATDTQAQRASEPRQELPRQELPRQELPPQELPLQELSPQELSPQDGPRRAPAVCLSEIERETALRVGLVSLTPAPLCGPTYQIIEIRNDGGAPLGEARLNVTPPLGEGRMRFAPLPGSTAESRRYVEISTDDGASWSLVDPPLGAGTTEDPLVFSSAQIPALRRLGASGEKDDSVLVRWRAALGERFGEPFASEALLGLSGSARDACGRPVRAALRLARLSLTRPTLIAQLEGRNVTRGGGFSREVRAAPRDEIEWRVALENIGEAPAEIARAALSEDGGDGEGDQVLTLDGVVPGARRTATARMRAGGSCRPRIFRAAPSWGCVAPPKGAAAGLRPLSEGDATARLLLEPDPNAIALSLAMTGEDGSPRPGDRALVRVEIRNDGPPAFAPELQVVLPDGYAVDRERPITLFSMEGALAQAVWAPPEDAANADGEARIRLLNASGAPATLDPEAFAQVSFPAERIRRSALETDRLTARIGFASACGDQDRSRPARLQVAPRQSDLSAKLEPIDPAVLSGPGQVRRFRATISNGGEEAAERLTARLILGRGWALETPAPEICAPEGPAEERVFACKVADAARPGAAVSFEFAATAGSDGGPPDTGLLEQAAAAFDESAAPDFSIELEVQAFRGEVTDAERPIAAARASSGAIGFRLSQRLYDAGGATWPTDRPIDLGDEVTLALKAVWWGGGRAQVIDPTLIQTLPAALSVRAVEGRHNGESVGAAVRAEQSQVLWGLKSFDGAGRFEGTLRAVAIDVDPPAAAVLGGAPAEPASESAEAEAVFSLRGETYGVDALAGAPTAARPLVRAFRKPDLRLSLTLDDKPAPGVAAPAPVFAGERLTGRLSLRNAGAGPGYVDWVELQAPPGVIIEPLGSDRLDNDGDGRIDEGDEGEAALRQSGDGGSAVRWIRLPEGEGRRIGEAGARLAPGAGAAWPVALRIEPTIRPGADLEVGLAAQFGSKPFVRRESAGRARASAPAPLRSAAVEGALALTETVAPASEEGGAGRADLDRRIRHGERVEHRAILRMPPGAHRGARMVVALPPALSAAQARALRVAAAARCENGGSARTETIGPPEARRLALVWTLGDCLVAPDAPAEARTFLMDLVGVARDVDPATDVQARAAWREAELTAWFERAGRAAEERERHPIGASRLTLTGPLLSARVAAPRPAGATGAAQSAPPRFDAGDRIETVIEVVNHGDAPAERVTLRLAPPFGASLLECRTAFVRAERGTALGGAAGSCGVGAMLARPLEPGESARFSLKARVREDAPIGGQADYPVTLSGVAVDLKAPVRAGEASLTVAARAAPPPILDAALRSALSAAPAPANRTPELSIGEAFRLRGAHPIPEGEAEAVLAFRLRATGSDGAPVEGLSPKIKLVEASLARSLPDLELGADPGRLNARPAETRAAITGAVDAEAEPDAEGWRRFSLPLGRVRRAQVSDGAADARLVFEAVLAIEDDPALREGLKIEAEAITEIAGAPPAAARRIVARLAEPALTVAVRARAASGGVRPGDRAVFAAEICNRGAAPAFGVVVEGALPRGFTVDQARPPRFVLGAARPEGSAFGDGPAPAARPGGAIGTVRVDPPRTTGAGARLTARAGDRAAIRPQSCAVLTVEALTEIGAEGGLASSRFAVASYRSRPAAAGSGRRYLGGPAGRSALRVLGLDIARPEPLEVEPGEAATARFTVSAPEAVETMRLSLELESGDALGWTLWRDANGDGALDVGDPPWTDGYRLERGGAVTVFAAARAPGDIGPRWRRAGVLRATALGASGRLAAGLSEFSMRRRQDRLGVMTAERLMAVDRDCDGELADESAQDAMFETAKDAAQGECLVMRLAFRNDGAAALESVSIEDRPPLGLRYEPGGARIVQTPDGLISGAVHEPSAGADEDGRPDGFDPKAVRFQFVGALAPGRGGVVEYRLRLPLE